MSELKLDSILTALRNSRKLKHWAKPPKDFGPDNPEDSEYNRNGLKDVGDLSKVTFSHRFSFGDNNNDDNDTEESKPGTTWTSTTPDLVRLEEPVEVYEPCGGDSLYIARRAREQYQITLQLEELALENECRQTAKERSKVWHEAYLNQLNKIRAASENEWSEYILSRDEKLADDEDHLRERDQEAEQAVIQCKNEYSHYIAQRSSELLDAFERAQRQEAEEANIRRLHLNNLQHAYANFVGHVTHMRELYKEVDGSEALDTDTEGFLNQTATQVEDLLNNTHPSAATQEQFDKAQACLEQGFISLKEITQSLNIKKEEKARLQQEKAAQEAEANKAKAQQVVQSEEVVEEEPDPQHGAVQEEISTITKCDNKIRFIELTAKVQHFLKSKKELVGGRKMKLSQLTKPVNQLSVTDQFINRDRLQQILSVLAGREVEPGKGSVNNASELLYLKNLLALNIVKLGTSHDKSNTAVYAWLLVNIVITHPDMTDLFFYQLFNECKGLLPVQPDRSIPCSVDFLHRELGRRDQEGVDSFSRRNGNAAYMYGLVLAMLSKRKGSPEQAPVTGWQLLAKILSAPPIPCVTCEILLDFLKAFGFTLQQTYGKQVFKLMVYLSKVYLPLIDEIKGDGGIQSFVMLQTFLKEFETRGKLQQDAMLDKYK